MCIMLNPNYCNDLKRYRTTKLIFLRNSMMLLTTSTKCPCCFVFPFSVYPGNRRGNLETSGRCARWRRLVQTLHNSLLDSAPTPSILLTSVWDAACNLRVHHITRCSASAAVNGLLWLRQGLLGPRVPRVLFGLQTGNFWTVQQRGYYTGI